MKLFRFQQFDIKQSSEVFRVGTDGVLLGALAQCAGASRALEIGTGTGLISLMLAQRNPELQILALDINPQAVALAQENFLASPFSSRLRVQERDFKMFSSENQWDWMVSNPPYFDENTSQKDVLARQKIELEFSDLIHKSSEFLTEQGVLSLIIPAESGAEMVRLAAECHFHLIRKINIQGIKGGKVKRFILEFSKTPKPLNETTFTIEEKARQYSSEYLELTKAFHCFDKK